MYERLFVALEASGKSLAMFHILYRFHSKSVHNRIDSYCRQLFPFPFAIFVLDLVIVRNFSRTWICV